MPSTHGTSTSNSATTPPAYSWRATTAFAPAGSTPLTTLTWGSPSASARKTASWPSRSSTAWTPVRIRSCAMDPSAFARTSAVARLEPRAASLPVSLIARSTPLARHVKSASSGSPVSSAITVTRAPCLSLRRRASSTACSSHSLSRSLRNERSRSRPSLAISSSSTRSGTILSGTTMSIPLPLSERAEFARVFVPRRHRRPGRHGDDHEQEGRAPAEHGGQEDGDAELAEQPRLREHRARERGREGEAEDRDPELHLPFARAPDGARPAAPRERHPDAEDEAAREGADAGRGEDPLAPVLEVGELEDREPERADQDRQCRGSRVLAVARHEGLAEGTDQAEARPLEDDAEGDAEEQEDPLRHVPPARVDPRQREEHQEEQRADPGLAAHAVGPRAREDSRGPARPPRPVRQLPEEIAEPEPGAHEQPQHHAEARERERARRAEEAADVAAEREHRADAHERAAERALAELPARRHADRELAREERGGEPAQEHAQVDQRAGVEPGRDEVGPLEDADPAQHPVAPVPDAVGRRERAVEREQGHVDGRDQDCGAPHRPRPLEEGGVLLAEGRHGVVIAASISSAMSRTSSRPSCPVAFTASSKRETS